jgi:predicted small secreted protein
VGRLTRYPEAKEQEAGMKHLVLALCAGLLVGCNTVDGVGRDISTGATKVGGWFRWN